MNRVLLSILRKEFMHIWRDPQTLLIILVWPVLMLLVFSYAITLEMRGIPTGLVDLSGSPDSRHLVQSITASGFFDLVEQELHPEEYEELFQRGAVRCIIVIPADYSRSLATEPVTAVQVLIDAADPNAANFIHNYLNSILLDTSFELNRISVIPFTLSPRFLYNPDLSSTHFFVPGLIAVILLLISALLTSIAIVREKEMGTLEQVLVSPARARQIILGKVIPYILLGFLDGAIVLAVGILWFQVPLHGELWQVLLAMLLYITPGSEQVKDTIERDGFSATFERAGGMMLANACGPCIGQWARAGADEQQPNSIMISFNRNFAKRNDGNPNTHSFVVSPEIATVFALAGRLDFNPLTDALTNRAGEPVQLPEPQGEELPPAGFVSGDRGIVLPPINGEAVEIPVSDSSERLQLLTPFEPWDGKELTGLKLLIKVKGKCTTDHISMAGPWLKYRGHLENISGNLLIGATNTFNDSVDSIRNQLNGEYQPVPEVARAYQAAGVETLIVGDENYGEGSSREHAAMEPRFLKVRVVLTRSFARIHETNLKKQGMLAVTFADPADYEKIREDDICAVEGLGEFAPGSRLELALQHSDGSRDQIELKHTYSHNQIAWFKAGSALNHIRNLNRVE